MEVRFRKLVAPIGIQLELTPLCSNKCFHCYNYWRNGDVPTTKAMTETDFLKVIDILAEAKVFYVTLTGGEPLFVKPLWRKVVTKLALCDIACDMNSNLVNIDQESIALMKDCGLISVLTSFHSYKEDTHDAITNNPGSFRKTLANIQRLAENDISVSVNMVVTQRNFRDVYDTCRFLKEKGIKSFNATRLQDPVKDRDISSVKITIDEIKFVIEQLFAAENDFGIPVGSVTPYPFCFLANDKKLFRLSQRTCNAGITIASLEYTGFLRACPTSEERYGNIFSDGLESCWQKMYPWREGVYIPPDCNGCFYLLACKGGCRVEGMKIDKMDQRDELMSGPIKREVKGLIPEQNKSYSLDDSFVICNKIKYRKEDFGYTVVGHKVISPAFISDTVCKTLLRFKERKEVSVKNFMDEWGVNLSDICELFSCLEGNEIITRKKRKEVINHGT